LPDGGLLDVSELDYRTAAGVRLEGHGIKPDEAVVIHAAIFIQVSTARWKCNGSFAKPIRNPTPRI